MRAQISGGSFGDFRLQVAVAKIQQNIPELKRDGNNVLSSQCAQLLYAENSTNRATTVFTLMEFVPALQTLLAEEPRKVVSMFEEIRKYCTCAILQALLAITDVACSDHSVWG